MRRKSWSPLRWQKNLFSVRQATFSSPYKNLAVERGWWDDYPLLDECPKYLFQLPNPRNDIVLGVEVPPAYLGLYTMFKHCMTCPIRCRNVTESDKKHKGA